MRVGSACVIRIKASTAWEITSALGLAEEWIGVRARAPAGEEGRAHGQGRPPGGKNGFLGEQEAGRGKALVSFPKGFLEPQHNTHNLSDGELAGRPEGIARLRFEVNSGFRLENTQRHGDDDAPAANDFVAAGESVPDANRYFRRLPDDAFDNGIEAEFARGFCDAREQMKRD